MTQHGAKAHQPRRQPPTDGWGAGHFSHMAPNASANGASLIPLNTLSMSLDAMAAIAERMTDGAGLLDASGHIRFANPALRAMLGRSEAELVGRRIEEFLDDATASAAAAHEPWRVAPRTIFAHWRRSDGGSFEARLAIEPTTENGRNCDAMLLMTPTAMLARNDTTNMPPNTRGEAASPTAQRWVSIIETIGDVALARLPLQDSIEAMLNRIRPTLDLENAALLLLNTKGDMLEAEIVAGAGREFAHAVHVPANDPTICEVFAARKPLIYNDAENILRRSGFFPEPLFSAMSVHSMLLAPLTIDDQVIGLVYLGADDPNHFTNDDVRLARVAVARIALAIGNSRARETARKATQRMSALADAGATLVGPLDSTIIANRLVDLITPNYCDACALYLVQEDGMAHKVAVKSTETQDLTPPVNTAIAQMLERLPEEAPSLEITLEPAPTVPRRRRNSAPRFNTATAIHVPVESHGQPVGVLLLIATNDRMLDPDDITLVHGLASRAAIGMEIARLYGELGQALKQVSETAMQLDSIFESTDAGIFITDATGYFFRMNAYGARMFGGDGISLSDSMRKRSEQRQLYEIQDEQGRIIPRHELPPFVAIAHNEPAERRVIIHLLNTGKDTPALIRCSPIRGGHGEVTGVVGVVMDITGIHEIERQKDEFLGIVSHELKTPLTTLKILSQMLTRRMRATNEPRAQDQAERMTTAINRMERLIGDLLDASRIHEGKLTLKATVCDLGAICRDAVIEQEITTQRKIIFNLPDRESLPIHADMEKLRQVVTNLLSNALKYSPANEPVIIRIRESGANYLVSVEDRGPGISVADQRRLFQRFYRVNNVRVQSGSGMGFGLGLFISREIVNAHDGEIWVDAAPGHGSVFTFSIPRASHLDSEDLEAIS